MMRSKAALAKSMKAKAATSLKRTNSEAVKARATAAAGRVMRSKAALAKRMEAKAATSVKGQQRRSRKAEESFVCGTQGEGRESWDLVRLSIPLCTIGLWKDFEQLRAAWQVRFGR